MQHGYNSSRLQTDKEPPEVTKYPSSQTDKSSARLMFSLSTAHVVATVRQCNTVQWRLQAELRSPGIVGTSGGMPQTKKPDNGNRCWQSNTSDPAQSAYHHDSQNMSLEVNTNKTARSGNTERQARCFHGQLKTIA